MQRHAHRHVGVGVNALEVDVQHLGLVGVHLESTQHDEFVLAVQFHGEDRGVELFLLQIVVKLVVINLNRGGGNVHAVNDAGNLGLTAQAAARTRTLRLAGSGDEFHG